MTHALPPKRTILARGLRCLCPACGVGRVFVRGFISADACPSCGFCLERGPGHTIGGAEVNLLVTFPVCVALLAVPAFLGGGSWVTASLGALLATAVGVGIHRPCRGVFFAIDYILEPDWVPSDEDPASGRDADGGPERGPRAGPDAPTPPAPPVPPAPPEPLARIPLVHLPIPTPAPRPDAEPVRLPTPSPSPH